MGCKTSLVVLEGNQPNHSGTSKLSRIDADVLHNEAGEFRLGFFILYGHIYEEFIETHLNRNASLFQPRLENFAVLRFWMSEKTCTT